MYFFFTGVFYRRASRFPFCALSDSLQKTFAGLDFAVRVAKPVECLDKLHLTSVTKYLGGKVINRSQIWEPSSMFHRKAYSNVLGTYLMLALFASSTVCLCFGDEPLQGGLTENQYLKPKRKKKQSKLDGLTGAASDPLQGGVQEGIVQPLNGGLESNVFPIGTMQAGAAQSGPTGTLQGSANQGAPLQGYSDADSANQELLIEWDRWRNNLQKAIQNNVIARINVHNNVNFFFDPRQQMMVSRYPLGISAWYSCDVLPNKTIINIRITQSSGIQAYDQAVYQAIADLSGSNTLRYPKGSTRQIVNQQASIGTATSNQYQNFQFGDVERQNFRR